MGNVLLYAPLLLFAYAAHLSVHFPSFLFRTFLPHNESQNCNNSNKGNTTHNAHHDNNNGAGIDASVILNQMISQILTTVNLGLQSQSPPSKLQASDMHTSSQNPSPM